MDLLGEELRQITGNPGVTVGVTTEARMSLVMQMVMDKMFPPGSIHRLKFDVEYEEKLWETHLKEGYETAKREIDNLKLQMRGVQLPGGPGGLIVPG
jgi:hypothetical protein